MLIMKFDKKLIKCGKKLSSFVLTLPPLILDYYGINRGDIVTLNLVKGSKIIEFSNVVWVSGKCFRVVIPKGTAIKKTCDTQPAVAGI